jgi:hypothetical protein
LGLTTIGAVDCNKKQREKLRRGKARIRDMQRRRRAGAKPRAEYEADSLTRTQPWKELGISESTWRRRRRKAGDRSARAAVLRTKNTARAPKSPFFSSAPMHRQPTVPLVGYFDGGGAEAKRVVSVTVVSEANEGPRRA